jgi:hypothetical protein
MAAQSPFLAAVAAPLCTSNHKVASTLAFARQGVPQAKLTLRRTVPPVKKRPAFPPAKGRVYDGADVTRHGFSKQSTNPRARARPKENRLCRPRTYSKTRLFGTVTLDAIARSLEMMAEIDAVIARR